MYSAFTSPGQAGCRTRLTACGETQAAFERRCIPPEPRRFAALCVAFRSKYTRYSSLTRLVSRAPPRSRRSPGFHHRLLTACGKSQAAFGRRSIPAEPLRFAPFCVAFRLKYTRYSSLTRLVSRTPTGRTGPHRPRRSPGFHHRLLTQVSWRRRSLYRPRLKWIGGAPFAALTRSCADQRSAFQAVPALPVSQRFAPSPAFRGRCRSEGPHRENCPAFPARCAEKEGRAALCAQKTTAANLWFAARVTGGKV